MNDKIIRNIIFWGMFIAQLLNARLIDLEDLKQDSVLSTTRIVVPEYPHAFNPSIIRWQNKILMSFRVIPDPKQSFTSYLGLVWLDEDFQPLGTPTILSVRDEDACAPSRAEDGRLISVGDHLYLVYSDNEDEKISKGGFRCYVAEIVYMNKKFALKSIERLQTGMIERLTYFDAENPAVREKNWVPFVKNNQLLLAYSLAPHKIFRPLLDGSQRCQTVAISKSCIDWQWGELRGGTPALFDGTQYLAFFHSSKKMTSIHSPTKAAPHYFMGAYTFSARFPFEITSMSPQPIIGKNFYHGHTYKPYWGSVVAVFPCGYIADENYIWLAYGRADHELWIAQLDKKKLYKSLVPIEKNNVKHTIAQILGLLRKGYTHALQSW